MPLIFVSLRVYTACMNLYLLRVPQKMFTLWSQPCKSIYAIRCVSYYLELSTILAFAFHFKTLSVPVNQAVNRAWAFTIGFLLLIFLAKYDPLYCNTQLLLI